MDLKLVIVQMSWMRVIQPLEIPAVLDCQQMRHFLLKYWGVCFQNESIRHLKSWVWR